MKDTRINVRIPVSEKELWQQVADTHGMSLTELVTRSVRSTILNLQQQGNYTYGNSPNSFTTGTAGTFGATGYVVWDTTKEKEK